MFVRFNSKVVNADTIDCVTYDDLKVYGWVHVHFKDGRFECVEGGQAIQLIMELDPDALEGEALRYERGVWAVHNTIGHPLMQICAWLGCSRLGLWIHDITVLTPTTKNK